MHTIDSIAGDKAFMLRELYRRDTAFRRIIDTFGVGYERQFEIDVDVAEEKALLPRRSDAINLLRKMAELGLGSFRIGRRGHGSRLITHWPLKEIYDWIRVVPAPAGNGKAADLPQGAEAEAAFAATVPQHATIKMADHGFLLRPNLTVYFNLPQDLTKAEAARLASFIQAIPF